MKRLFAFGCSYTSYSWPTWADIIGVSFDEFYNFGRAGGSNTYSINTVIEADHLLKFNKETDTLIFMVTGFGRFSYIKEDGRWDTVGDMLHFCRMHPTHPVTKFYDALWNDEFAVYQSWQALKVFKMLVEEKGLKHHILLGIDNSYYLEKPFEEPFKSMANEIYSFAENKQSLSEWTELSAENKDSPVFVIEGRDGHPSMNAHYKFCKEHLPQYLTENSRDLLEYWNNNFVYASREQQSHKFTNEFISKKNKAFHVRKII